MLGLAKEFPRETVRVEELIPGKVVFRRAVIWHPPSGDVG